MKNRIGTMNPPVCKTIKTKHIRTIALLMVFCSVSLLSMPAKRTPTVVAQPDGTTFSIIGFGDERYNFAETTDGYVVIQGDDNFWYFAALSSEGRFIPGAARVAGGSGVSGIQSMTGLAKHLREAPQVVSAKMVNSAPGSSPLGELQQLNRASLRKTASSVKRILLLCVDFTDLAHTQTALSYQQMINDDAWKSNIGGVSKYYKEVSQNAVSVSGDYKDWIIAAQAKAYYANNNADYNAHVKELVKQCVDNAEGNGIDFSQYDNDGDGRVDGLFIVHAGKGAEEGSDLNYIWSHQGSLAGTYTITYDTKTIDRYIIVPELFNGNHVEIGVFCHEFAHMLGLPDTYDTNGDTNGKSEGIGNWCLMAGGSWGGNGSSPERPAHMSAYCKELLDYTTPTVVASSQALSIPQAETNAFSYKIWMDQKQADEYMLIENRQKTGFDLNLPNSGLVMYHIDKNLTDIWSGSNSINVTRTHLGIKVYEADGLEEMATAVNRGNAGDSYPGSTGKTTLSTATTPNSNLWNGVSSGVEINSISASSATMTAAAVLPVYNGYPQQFYRQYSGYALGTAGANTGYGMVKCTPARTGTLLGVRIFSYANKFTAVEAAAFTKLTGKTLTTQTGGTVSGASAATDNFLQLNFSPAIDVTQNVPIYVRIKFTVGSGGNATPVDISSPITNNSYTSNDGTTFTNQTTLDIPVRIVFQSNSPMPIEITAFTASAKGSRAELAWSTATEINNYGFDIERAVGHGTSISDDWLNIGFVKGNGTTNAPQSYSFVDNSASGKTAYRLKQIDRDGQFEYTKVVEVTAADAPAAFTLSQNYPNPFNPATVISYSIASASHVSLKVFDMLGREITTLVNGQMEPGSYTAAFDGSRFSSGVYFYRLDAGNFSDVKRLSIMK